MKVKGVINCYALRFRRHKVAVGIIGGLLIVAILTTVAVEGFAQHTKSEQRTELTPYRGNRLVRGLPSVIVSVNQYTPFATDTKYFVAVEEDVPDASTTPTGHHKVNVTLVVPGAKASSYQAGQRLTPAQTDDLIDSSLQ